MAWPFQRTAKLDRRIAAMQDAHAKTVRRVEALEKSQAGLRTRVKKLEDERRPRS